jgi:hypothetical protein
MSFYQRGLCALGIKHFLVWLHLRKGCSVCSLQGSPSSSTDGSTNSSSKSTVYTVRLTTSWDRGSALSEPMAGVNICLISKDGRAVLHRISPVNDPKDNLQVMQHICSVSGPLAGTTHLLTTCAVNLAMLSIGAA